jgi:hypothetical protein
MPIIKEYFDQQKNRHMSIAPILDLYQNNPDTIIKNHEFDKLQARIILTQDHLLNPKSGVQIHRYTTANKKQIEKYQEKFKNTMEAIFKDWIIKNSSKKSQHSFFQNSPLMKLLRLMNW